MPPAGPSCRPCARPWPQRAELDELSEKLAAREDAAEMTAQQAMTRAALSRIGAALDAGTGFAPALSDLRAAGVDVPADLASVADDGVATLNSLQARFPDLAREALAAARAAGADGPQGDVMAFLRAQLGLRSLEPRAGDDPDAILSRAGAALRDGRLTDTLAEIEQLPEPRAWSCRDGPVIWPRAVKPQPPPKRWHKS